MYQISIHPPREGWDRFQQVDAGLYQDFNPPTPRGVGRCTRSSSWTRWYFNPPTPRGVGRKSCSFTLTLIGISIHPPREGWDCLPTLRDGRSDFNPPTPRGVGRSAANRGGPFRGISIHPPREGWDAAAAACTSCIGISIHPPREGWDGQAGGCGRGGGGISIHPPREGWDLSFHVLRVLSVGISIHPPREGWDVCGRGAIRADRDFNPPTPRGVGQTRAYRAARFTKFQSTHPARGGTTLPNASFVAFDISIHPPREGWDLCGMQIIQLPKTISIHPPREGWDGLGLDFSPLRRDFNPPTPRGVGL